MHYSGDANCGPAMRWSSASNRFLLSHSLAGRPSFRASFQAVCEHRSCPSCNMQNSPATLAHPSRAAEENKMNPNAPHSQSPAAEGTRRPQESHSNGGTCASNGQASFGGTCPHMPKKNMHVRHVEACISTAKSLDTTARSTASCWARAACDFARRSEDASL